VAEEGIDCAAAALDQSEWTFQAAGHPALFAKLLAAGLDPEDAQGQDQDREAIEPVRVEVAEHEDAFAACACDRQSLEKLVGVGQQPRVV